MFAFIFLLIHSTLFSQSVSTFANTPSNGDVAVDHAGNVYTVSENATVVRTSPDGTVDTIAFANGANFSRATGLAFDNSDSILYVTNRPLNKAGWITKVFPDGSSEIFVSNLYFPGDISFDEDGNLYVSQFDNIIKKIDPDGTVSQYVSSSQFNTALGIAWTPNDTLYVSSAHDGNIYKLTPGNPVQVEWFAYIDGLKQNWACGFMTYGNGKLFITNGDNIIHSIELGTGLVEDFAGSGIAGGNDGSLNQAQFSAPNGIGFNSDFSELYITEWGKNRIRKIDNLTSSIQKVEIGDFNIYPNPFNKTVHFQIELSKATDIQIDIFDAKGKLIKKITRQFPAGGLQTIEWNIEDNQIAGGVYYGKIRAGKGMQGFKVIYGKD